MKIVIISSIIGPHNVGIATEIHFLWHILRKILTKLCSICIMVAILIQDGGQHNTRKETPRPTPQFIVTRFNMQTQDNYFRFKAIVLSISYRNNENMLQVVPISTEI